MYEYTARCVRVVDGDTYDFDVDLGFRIAHRIRVRLADRDTPELRSKNPEEREHAKQAKAFVEKVLIGDEIEPPLVCIRTKKDRTGKYGRYLAEVFFLERRCDADGIQYAQIALGDMLDYEGLLKRESYPTGEDHERQRLLGLLDRHEEHRAMNLKRAEEGVMSPSEKTPVELQKEEGKG